jgi:hypothetical protein
MEQRRHFSRVLFSAKARLSAGSETHPCEVLDLSLKGALVRVAKSEHWTPARDCRLELELDAEQQAVIAMQARVSHRQGDVVGLHCIEIDLDSITHLRRLVELNVGDESVLQRELSALTTE